MIKEIKINNSTKKVVMKKEDRFLGVKGENKNETLKFTFEDNFLDGEGILEVQKPNSQKEYIILDKEEDCYLLEVKNSLLSLEGEIIMQLVVRMTDNRVFKSVEFSMQVLKAIEATTEIPDEYETWDSTLAAKILEIDSKLEEVTVLEEDLSDKVESGYFKGDKGDTGNPGQNGQDGKSAYQIWLDEGNVGTEEDFLESLKGENGTNGIDGHDGVDGQDAKINGVNTLTIEAGSNINLEQEGNTLTISSIGGGTSNYQDLTNKPSINDVTLSENKSLSDLGIQPAGNYLTSETDPTVPSYVKNITQENINSWNNKSDFSGDYNDLSNKPTIPAEVTENTVSGWGFTKNTGTYSKPQNGIPKTDLESAVQTSLGKADTALQAHQDISGKQDITDNSLTTTNKTISTAINEVNSIAKGANQALSYSNYQAMITAFNSLANNVYNIGQNVMIITLNVPDLWISSIESTSQTYTYTTDEAFTTELSTNGYVQVGYYKLSALETQKVDLTDYARTQDIPANLSELSDDSTHRLVTDTEKNNWNNKSNFSGNYNDLSNKPTIPSEVTENTVSNWGFTKNTGTYSKPQNGIPKTDLESAVQTSLGKADTALQSYTEQYTGTIAGITMNGVSKGTSGVVDLGTVITQHQDISGKLDTSKVKNAHSTTAGDVYDVRYINSVLGDIETLLQGV